MSNIRFISTHAVRPASNFHSNRIELIPWELRFLLLQTIQKGLLFHKPTPSQQKHLLLPQNDSKTLIQHLILSLSYTLDIFYPLAGRFAKVQNDDNTIHFFIDCNNAGVEFVHAIVDGVSVSDILDSIYVPEIVLSFFPHNGAFNYEGVSKSLLAVQVTELVDGFFIGCSLSHSAADGTSFWHFFNTWSEISRSMGFGAKPISQIPPNFERHSFFNGILELPVKFSLPDDTELNIQSSGDNGNSIQLKQRVFRFSKEKIAELKAKANSQMGTSKISSFQALLAHIWQCVTRNRPVDDEDVVKYNVIVGTRSRLQPPLPPQYFGSAALIRSVKATAGELKKPEALGWAAWEIHKLVASQTSLEVRKDLEDWVQCPELVKFGDCILQTHILTTGSSPRFDVYGNDFGWGRPVAVRSGGANKSDGKITVFEGAEEGSIQFEVCLSAKTLQALGEDVDFMSTIST